MIEKRLCMKVNNIDTSGFVLKTKYDTDKSNLEKKIIDAVKNTPDTRGKETDYNTKITEIEDKIRDVNKLVKKTTGYDTKISDIESKYITTTDYNKFTKEIVDNNI